MGKVNVGIAGYGVIGQRLADGVAAQQDMELVGVADVAATLPVRALKERGMPYKMFCAVPGKEGELEKAGIPVSGSLSCLFGRGFDPILEGAMHACGRTLFGIRCSR